MVYDGVSDREGGEYMARNVKTISVCLPGYLRMWVRNEAEERGLSVSAFVTMALTGVYRREAASNGTESTEAQSRSD